MPPEMDGVCPRPGGWLAPEQPRFHLTPWPGGPARSLLGVLLLGSSVEGLGASVHVVACSALRVAAARVWAATEMGPPRLAVAGTCFPALSPVHRAAALPPPRQSRGQRVVSVWLFHPALGCWQRVRLGLCFFVLTWWEVQADAGAASRWWGRECGCSSDVHFARCFCKKQKQQEAAPHQAGGEQVPPCGQCWGDGRLFRQGRPSPRSRTLEILATLQPVRGVGVTRLFWINHRIWGAWQGRWSGGCSHVCGHGAEISCVIVSPGCLGLFPFM